MRTMIENYANTPGDHCGSVAMRSLLGHYCDLQLPEGAVFGLGSGIDSVFISSSAMDPKSILFGRTATMELDLADALGLDYREQTENDDAQAWQSVREEVLAGRPTMLSGDIFYLDYREFTVHFPGHRFVLLGFDDSSEKAFIADRINAHPEACSYAALAASRNPEGAMSTRNLWGKFHSTKPTRTLTEAAKVAIERSVSRMIGDKGSDFGALSTGSETNVVSGVAGTMAFAEQLAEWQGREDAKWLASYNSRCIEKFGNGGGNFRRMYAAFLGWAHDLDQDLVPADAIETCIDAADTWTTLAATLDQVSQDGGDTALWQDATKQANTVAQLETKLFESLG